MEIFFETHRQESPLKICLCRRLPKASASFENSHLFFFLQLSESADVLFTLLSAERRFDLSACLTPGSSVPFLSEKQCCDSSCDNSYTLNEMVGPSSSLRNQPGLGYQSPNKRSAERMDDEMASKLPARRSGLESPESPESTYLDTDPTPDEIESSWTTTTEIQPVLNTTTITEQGQPGGEVVGMNSVAFFKVADGVTNTLDSGAVARNLFSGTTVGTSVGLTPITKRLAHMNVNSTMDVGEEFESAVRCVSTGIGSFVSGYQQAIEALPNGIEKVMAYKDFGLNPTVQKTDSIMEALTKAVTQIKELRPLETFATKAAFPPLGSVSVVAQDNRNIIQVNNMAPAGPSGVPRTAPPKYELVLMAKQAYRRDPLKLVDDAIETNYEDDNGGDVQISMRTRDGDNARIRFALKEHAQVAEARVRRFKIDGISADELYDITLTCTANCVVKTASFSTNIRDALTWIEAGKVNEKLAIERLTRKNPYWFPSSFDIEKIEIHRVGKTDRYILEIRTSVRTYQRILAHDSNERRLDLQVETVNILEMVPLEGCYKCCEFGHESSDCLRPDDYNICRFCGGGHRGAGCEHRTNPKCFRCITWNAQNPQMKPRNTRHHALHHSCLDIKKRLNGIRAHHRREARIRNKNDGAAMC